MKRLAYLIYVILFPICLAAQDAIQLDSVQQLLRKDSNNTGALLGLAQLKQANPDTDYYLSTKVIEIASRTRNYHDLAFAHNRIGVLYFFAGEYDTALVYFRKVYSIANKQQLHYIAAKALTNIGQIYVIHDQSRQAIDTLLLGQRHLKQEVDRQLMKEQQVRLGYLLGETYSHIGAYAEAIKTLLDLRVLYDTNPELKGKGNILNGLGNTYLLMEQFPAALRYFHQALDFYSKENDVLNKQKALYNLAHTYRTANNIDSAMFWYQTAMKHNETLQDDTQLPFLYELRANLFRDKKQIDSALVYYDKAINLYNASGADGRVGECFYNLGNLFLENKMYKQAIQNLTDAVQKFREAGLIEEEQNASWSLAKSEFGLGNYQRAIQHFEHYDSLRRQTDNIEKTRAITLQEVKYETSLKEALIAKQEAEIALRTEQNYWLLGGASFTTLAFLAIGISYRKIRRQKAVIAKQKQEILHNNRNSIQQLISIFGRQGEEVDYKDKAVANQERLFTLNLLNGLLYESKGEKVLNMQTYLQELCNAKQISYNIPISLKAQSIALKTDLLKDVGLIVNELTTNAGKYSVDEDGDAGDVEITIGKIGNTLQIVCKDSGKGLPDSFDILASRQSFGLSFVQDLVQQHNGKIKAYNDNGACFEITLEI